MWDGRPFDKLTGLSRPSGSSACSTRFPRHLHGGESIKSTFAALAPQTQQHRSAAARGRIAGRRTTKGDLPTCVGNRPQPALHPLTRSYFERTPTPSRRSPSFLLAGLSIPKNTYG